MTEPYKQINTGGGHITNEKRVEEKGGRHIVQSFQIKYSSFNNHDVRGR